MHKFSANLIDVCKVNNDYLYQKDKKLSSLQDKLLEQQQLGVNYGSKRSTMGFQSIETLYPKHNQYDFVKLDINLYIFQDIYGMKLASK